MVMMLAVLGPPRPFDSEIIMSSYISQAFNHWVAGLPTGVLVLAIALGSVVWLLSLAQITRRQLTRGAR